MKQKSSEYQKLQRRFQNEKENVGHRKIIQRNNLLPVSYKLPRFSSVRSVSNGIARDKEKNRDLKE